MKLRSRGMLRCAAPLATLLLLSGCSDGNRPIPLTEVETIEIPVADVDNQQNTNIDNPTLDIPTTFPVRDGDLLTLVWSDEFDGSALDPEVWFYESGDGTQYGIPSPSFGNNELQYYLPDNVQLGNGTLQITARREQARGYNVTSGRVMTRDRFAFTYGRIEASIKLPPGQGTWPAFWMLSQADEPNAAPGFGTYGVYAQSGEIDIVEAVNLKGTPGPGGVGGGNEIFSTIHFGGDSSIRQNQSSETRYTPSEDVTADFHTYAFEWDPFEMRWYFNGVLYKMENSWSSTGGPFPAPFDKPFYVLFNLAAGGNFPGGLGADALPATMEVDWVRVYSGQPPPPPDFDSGLLTNGDFESGTAPWLAGVTNPIGAENVIPDPDNAANSVYFVNVTAAGNPFDVNLSQKLTITPDETYEVTFRARSNVARTMLVGIGLSDGDFSNVTQEVNLTADWQDYTVELTAAGFGDANSRVLFDTGAEVGEVYIDNVRLVVSDGEPPFDGGLVTNGDFQAGTTPWLAGVDNPIGMENVIDDALNPGNSVYFVDVTAAGNAFDVNLSQRGITIAPDEAYSLSFKARSNVSRTMLAGIGLSSGDFSNVTQSVDLSTDWQDFTVALTAAGFGDADSRVLFDMGAAVGEVYIDDVSLVVAGGGGGPGAGDIAVNGGFEAGDLSDWALFPVSADPNEQAVVTTNPKSGTYAGRINNTTPGSASIIKQANRTPVAVGQTATISFSARGSFGPGGVAFAEFFEEMDPEGVANATILGGGPLALDADPEVWADFNFVVPITTDVSGGVTLQLTGTTGGDASSFADVYYDDISIVISGGGG